MSFEKFKLEREINIDYHKTSQHVPVKIDITFFNAHCELLDMDYRDVLGQHIHKLPLTKFQITKQKTPNSKEYKDTGITGQKLLDDAKEFPGCRVIGTLDKSFKAESVVTIGFRDKEAAYNSVKHNQDVPINLNYKLNSFILGNEELRECS